MATTKFIRLQREQAQLHGDYMAHYAFLDANNIVTEVIVGKEENDNGVDWEKHYSDIRGQICKRTSYNTRGNKHLYGGVPYRKNYAGVGYFYDAQLDAFIPPKPYPSWLLNTETCLWEAPVPLPQDGKFYTWDENSLVWVPPWEPPIPAPDDGNMWFWNEETQNWERDLEFEKSHIASIEVFK